MLTGATRGRGGSALARHLLRADANEAVVPGEGRGLAAEDVAGQLRELAAGAAHGRSARPLYHLHADPDPADRPVTEAERADFWQRMEAALGLEAQPFVEVDHRKHGRDHTHRVYSLTRADGRTVDLSHDFLARQRVAVEWCAAHGRRIPPIKHERAVLAHLDRENPAAAAAMRAVGMDGSAPARVARQTPQERAQAERTGVAKADVGAAVLAAWRASDDGRSLEAALAQAGLRLAKGDKAAVVVDAAGGTHPLARLLGSASKADGDRIPAAAVKERLVGLPLPPVGDAQHAIREARQQARSARPTPGWEEAPAGPAAALTGHAGTPRDPEGRARPASSPVAPGAAGGGRGAEHRGVDPRGYRAPAGGAAAPLDGHRGPAQEGRQADLKRARQRVQEAALFATMDRSRAARLAQADLSPVAARKALAVRLRASADALDRRAAGRPMDAERMILARLGDLPTRRYAAWEKAEAAARRAEEHSRTMPTGMWARISGARAEWDRDRLRLDADVDTAKAEHRAATRAEDSARDQVAPGAEREARANRAASEADRRQAQELRVVAAAIVKDVPAVRDQVRQGVARHGAAFGRLGRDGSVTGGGSVSSAAASAKAHDLPKDWDRKDQWGIGQLEPPRPR